MVMPINLMETLRSTPTAVSKRREAGFKQYGTDVGLLHVGDFFYQDREDKDSKKSPFVSGQSSSTIF